VLNERFGWTHSWIPNGQSHTVYLGVHGVPTSMTTFNHSCVIVFVAPSSTLLSSTSDWRGEFAREFWESGVMYATLGAGDVRGRLRSRY
jgi:hypothetical protein